MATTTNISETFLTEKVETFASALITIDTFWKLVNILITISAGFTTITGVNPSRNVAIFYLVFIVGILLFYKIVDLVRVFSLGIGWVLLSINKNLEN